METLLFLYTDINKQRLKNIKVLKLIQRHGVNLTITSLKNYSLSVEYFGQKLDPNK